MKLVTFVLALITLGDITDIFANEEAAFIKGLK